MNDYEVQVEHEEIITHGTAEEYRGGFKGGARIIGDVIIDGKNSHFNKVVPIRFTKSK